ncbi:glycosyltransferase [Flavobacterium adhaerens]|uniref:glycosyltransferase n=1 Tax=Flavobacterium adhaerens TaxID=3149043 RepID=UPI0032B3DCEE
MNLLKKIRVYFKKKDVIKRQLDQSIPNFHLYNSELKTIVFIHTDIPKPDKDSGSNRLKEIILAFKEQNYNCIVCVENTFRKNKYAKYFSDLGIIVFVETNQYPNYLSFLQAIPNVDFIWYGGPNALNDFFKKVSKALPKTKTIFDMVDLHFLRYQRAIKIQPTRISLRKKHQKFLHIETKLAKNTDYVITISDIEKKIMEEYIDPTKLITISNIHYPKIKKENTLPFEQRKDLLFIGSTHDPNIDAVYYLYKEIMPIVWQKLPDIKVNIIGNINKKINCIFDSRFVFKGYVPDVESYFTHSKMMVAPLRYGAGVKGKIGQAFEYYLPTITTTVGAEGMQLVHQKNAIIDDTKEGFANAIIEIYNHKELWQKFHDNSEQSLEPFSKDKIKEQIVRFK